MTTSCQAAMLPTAGRVWGYRSRAAEVKLTDRAEGAAGGGSEEVAPRTSDGHGGPMVNRTATRTANRAVSPMAGPRSSVREDRRRLMRTSFG
ncbi:hypothetical protein [Stappia sp. TSB10P1A]|uniref:hypothetical protein n=1 Tax=Stappia sp. TSB10P1A TaxID=2003585 RepID=UPI001643AA4D|nr:hypothetical protein [Stappia sp. TSB10P1A]